MTANERARECWNNPEWATSLGLHTYRSSPDSRWVRIVADAIRAAEREAADEALEMVAQKADARAKISSEMAEARRKSIGFARVDAIDEAYMSHAGGGAALTLFAIAVRSLKSGGGSSGEGGAP